ncbi:MAG: hypothetical protein KDD52_09865, partial [Bdellovibrionales bacterium]|nr:hypothetical protein [Bdellovibrionales bacterium]
FLSKSFDNGDAKETISDPAILGCLLDFVSIDAELKKSVGYLFSNTYVVESIQEALDLQDRGVRASFVTLKGEVLSDHGVLQGGSLDHSLGDFEVLAQIEELKDKLVPLKAQKQSKDQEYQQTVRDLEKQAIQLKNISETLENELRKNLNLEKEFQKVEDQLSFTKEKIAEISEKISLYTQEKNQLGNVLDELDSKSQSLDASKKKVEESVQSQQQELVEIKTLHDEISTAVNELKIQFTTSVERIEGYRRELGIVQHQKTEAKTELEKTQNTIQTCKENTMSFTQTLENMHIQIEGMTTEYKDLESRNAVLQSQHDEVLEKIRQTEVLLKSTRDARESKQNELNQLQVKLSEHSMHMNHLQEQVFEKYETNLYEVTSSDTFERVELEDIGHQKGDLQEIKRKIEKIGNVNLAAIEEISEHTQRYDFLSEQKNDLEKSLASLSEAIKKINQTSKERFEETFEAIATRFHEIFPRLFSGGKGKLVLTDPENILTSGVDIQAQPPGKKLQNMNLLSGGEKALTAIALLFAIFEYKAPPFCVLDEVDAPLDDVNVMRYISIVEKMAKQTQFIVITHNKKTMEMADHLYGVTMEEPGVSRVVSVRLNQDEFIEKHALDTDQNRSVA